MKNETGGETKGAKMKITKRGEDFSRWYTDVIAAAEMADYAPVKGCMVIRPYGYAIWENFQKVLDKMFKETGHENAYFPLFIPESFLKREEKHVEGFSPELAVVTHAGGKKLEENLVVRPTSETIIYDSFSKWIESWRDLPLLINQWANVVRWEMRTRLFLRTTEFLWQEGHTAHATEDEAEEEVLKMLEIYRKFSEEYLALPVIPGRKSENEKFAGALRTYCIEGMMQDKKALQCGTSHNLGQNFAKVFDVKFLDQEGTKQYAWQTSWGVSTRLIGALIMAHGDDSGIIVPPKIAAAQAVVIPIWKSEEEREKVIEVAKKLNDELKESGVGVKLDERDLRPAWKYFEWERKGVPIRIELGPRDIEKSEAVLVRRDTGEKRNVLQKQLADEVKKELVAIQKNLFDRALKFQKENTFETENWEEFKKIMAGEGGFVKANWCGDSKCELEIKEETKATIRCIPFGEKASGKCIHCDKKAKEKVIFAQAY
ncbi:MAG TPA: proline--tRNA ligase [Patescibacteria group bacterium]|nr:proline--tRNA ligase [Patescibacteria group bacterium]